MLMNMIGNTTEEQSTLIQGITTTPFITGITGFMTTVRVTIIMGVPMTTRMRVMTTARAGDMTRARIVTTM